RTGDFFHSLLSKRCSHRDERAQPERSRKRATAARPTLLTARDCVEWPAPGTTTSLPRVVSASSSRAQASGVDRSWSPLTSSVGTSSFPCGSGVGVVGLHGRHCRTKPLSEAVRASNG